MRMREQVVIPHDANVKLESLAVSKSNITVFARSEGLQKATVYEITQAAGSAPAIVNPSTVAFQEAAYTLECTHQVLQDLRV